MTKITFFPKKGKKQFFGLKMKREKAFISILNKRLERKQADIRKAEEVAAIGAVTMQEKFYISQLKAQKEEIEFVLDLVKGILKK